MLALSQKSLQPSLGKILYSKKNGGALVNKDWLFKKFSLLGATSIRIRNLLRELLLEQTANVTVVITKKLWLVFYMVSAVSSYNML